MRVSDAHHSHDLRSFNLAIRMLSQEARTGTICVWTGLKPDRVRKLAKLQRSEAPEGHTRRRRGPSPSQLAANLNTPGLRSEAAAIAGVCAMLKVLPAESAKEAFPNIPRGEQLIMALELYKELVPHARLTFEQLALLSRKLADGEEWSIARCTGCPAMVVADRLALERPLCEDCQHEQALERKRARASKKSSKSQEAAGSPDPAEPVPVIAAVQLGLFDATDQGSG